MIREVDLVSYLPPYLQEYNQETVAALEAENPEFRLIWEASDRVLYNEFIATADEYGISRFEKILNILPSKEDTLESRRARVQSRWFTEIPYTLKALISKLIALCGDSNFEITKDFLYYKIGIETNLELFGQVEELEHIIETMLPCNMVVDSVNKIPCDADGVALWGGGICAIEFFVITNDEQAEHTITGNANVGGALSGAAAYFITNDSKETITANGSASHGGGIVNAVSVTITNDFNEQFNIDGTNSLGSGAFVTEIIGINHEE